MSDVVLVGLISACVTLVVCILNNLFTQKKMDADQDARMLGIKQEIAILNVKFDELTKKVEKHNGVVERTYKLEKDVEVIKEKQSVANHRINDIEKSEK